MKLLLFVITALFLTSCATGPGKTHEEWRKHLHNKFEKNDRTFTKTVVKPRTLVIRTNYPVIKPKPGNNGHRK